MEKSSNGDGGPSLPSNRDEWESWALLHGLRGARVGKSWESYRGYLQSECAEMRSGPGC